jgi:hypothetical protein
MGLHCTVGYVFPEIKELLTDFGMTANAIKAKSVTSQFNK